MDVLFDGIAFPTSKYFNFFFVNVLDLVSNFLIGNVLECQIPDALEIAHIVGIGGLLLENDW